MIKKVSSSGTKAPSQRQLRISEQIRHLLADAMLAGHFRDPVLQNASKITITSVDVSPDLKNANAYVMPLGGKDSDKVIEAINKASGFFRLEIGKKLEIRHIPKITFKLDKSFDAAEHVSRLLSHERARRRPTSDTTEE